MALGSALLALGAVVLVTLVALFTTAASFNDYRRTQLSADVRQLAQVIERQLPAGAILNQRADGRSMPGPGVFARQRFGANNMWVMDTSGQLVVLPQGDPVERDLLQQDEAAVTDALRRAMRGESVEGALRGTGAAALFQRYYAAVPLRAGGESGGQIVGAVALSTLPRADRGFVFLNQVNGTLLASALAAALVAALLAYIFSRRLTRPVARLTDAAALMASGDYAARVEVRAPDELRRLASAFNEMATALEADVTALRRQEQLRRDLVADVSHELATPLTAIQGFTEALLDDVVQDPTERVETTRLIAREAGRLRRLVDQLRQVALYEAGTQTLVLAPVDLAALVQETLAALAPEFERRDIRLHTSLPADLPRVNADADRMTEILLNLFDNALRHTPTGGAIEVAATRYGHALRLAIADTGPGIPIGERERVFDRFYRLDTSRSAATGGSGLGLAIVRSLVEAHGGTIAIDDRPRGGARFTISLPTPPELLQP